VAGRDATAGIDPAALERLFAPVMAAVAALPAGERAEATVRVQELKEEAAKGEKADDGRLARLIDGLVGLVPAAVGAVVSAFASPILGGIVGPATQFVLDRIQKR